MSKYLLLYIGPNAADVGMSHAPLTQASLDQWATTAGPALVDKGAIFASNGVSLQDNGGIARALYYIHGYSTIEAPDLNGAIALTRNHPFLSETSGGQANFEIQILEATEGERPLRPEQFVPKTNGMLPTTVDSHFGATDAAPVGVPAASPAIPQPPAPGAQPGPSPVSPEPQPTPAGELSIPHESESNDSQGGPGSQPPAGPPPGASIQPTA